MSWPWEIAASGRTPTYALPTGWSVARVGDITSLENGQPYESKFFGEEGTPLIRIRDVLGGPIETRYSGPSPTSHRVRKGDLLVGMDGDFNVGQWGHDEPGLLNQRVLALEAPPEISAWVGYCLPEPLALINELTYSTTVKHLTSQAVSSIRIPLPDRTNLRRLVDYLDHETAEIDAFIAELKRMTVLSQEDWRAQRDSALSIGRGKRGTTTVTKTWFSERASDWQEGPLKHLFDISLGKMLDEGRHVAGAEQYPYVRAGDIGDGTLNSSNLNRMPFSLREQRKFSINAGDILVVEGGSVGTNVVVEDSLDGIYFQKTVNRMRSKADAVPLFYSEVLNAYRESGVLDTVCNRSTIMHLTAEKLGGLVVPVPSVAEQRSLAKHLEATRGKAEKLGQECQRAIELATERRAALISAAVTGQIDMTKRRKPVAEVLKDEVRERV